MNSLVSRLPKSIDYRLLNNRLPVVLNIIFILACSYSLSQLTWLLIPLDPSSQQAPSARNNKNRISS
ncbi:MAG: hypothetical protein ACN4GM_04555, partial [Gammaproteobacteria bacterium]